MQHSFVVVGPIRSNTSTGVIARNLLRGLQCVGAEIGAVDTCRPRANGGACDELAPLFDAPVRLRGATVVHHGPLRDLARSLAQHPTPTAERRIAYIDWPLARVEEPDLEVLLPFDEVWLTTHYQRELFTACGLPRRRVHVVHPGVAREENDAREEMYVSTDATSAFPLACVQAMARGAPVAALDPLGTSEIVDEHSAFLIDRPASEANVRRALRRASDDPVGTAARAAFAKSRAIELCSLPAVGRSILERESSPLRAPPSLVTAILAELGLKSPADWLAGSRNRVVLYPIRNEHDDWRSSLRRFLSRQGPDDDVTLCLWIDAELSPLVESLTAAVEVEIERAQGPRGPGDVLLLSAPLEHVPWDRVALETAA